jgi:hypothetical protein
MEMIFSLESQDHLIKSQFLKIFWSSLESVSPDITPSYIIHESAFIATYYKISSVVLIERGESSAQK